MNFESDLLLNNEEFKNIFDTISLGIIFIDTEGQLVSMNPSAEKILGIPLNKINENIKNNKLDFIHEDGSIFTKNDLPSIIAINSRKKVTNIIGGLINKQLKEIKWLKINSIPLFRNKQKKPYLVYSTIEDISLQKRLLENLNESDFRYRELFNHISSGVAIYEVKNNGNDFIFKDLNKAGELIENDKKENLIGKNVLKARPGIKEFGLFDVFQRVWKTGKAEHFPISFYKDNNLSGWYENFVYKLPSGEIVAVFDNVTERKSKEVHLQNTLIFNKEIIASAGEGIIVYDKEFRYMEWNPFMEKLTGISKEKLIGKNAFEIFPHLREQGVDKLLERALTGEKVVSTNIRYRSPDSKNKGWVIGTYTPYLDKDGNIIGIIGIIRDITENKTNEEEREKLLFELTQKNKDLESLIYAASHDLRSPLVNIQGFSQWLEKGCNEIITLLNNSDMPEDLHKTIKSLAQENFLKALHYIKASISKMDSLIKGLLKLSRTGKDALLLQNLDMNSIMNKVISTFEYQIQIFKAKVFIEKLPHCIGDADKISQVFSNLIDNALKYRDESRNLIIKITGKIQKDKSIYTVMDNGIGIAKEHQDKIWELFYRLYTDEAKSGDGLGLTLSKRIVERHNGHIWIESKEGVGSSFFIELPSS